ncbi:MAG: GHKL domain-containing protein [Clostridia bacterium]|nr:GHKL domain-containing protein [Clostridia bacterium]
MVRIIAYILFACFEIYTMDMLFRNMSKKKLTGIALPIFMAIAITVNTVVSYFFAGTGVMLLGLGVVTAFVFALVYSVKIHFAIISSVLFVMIQAGAETIITLLSGMLMGEETLDFLQDDEIFLGMGLICKFFSFILIFFVSKRIGKVELGVSKGVSTLLIVQPIATVFVTLVILKCTYELESIPAILFSAVAVLMIASNLVTLFLIHRQKDYVEAKTRLSFANEQIENQLAHYEELYRYQNEIRTFRHDIKNKLLSVSGLLADGQIEKAAAAIKGEADFLDEANRGIINSGNPAVDAVLMSKLAAAEKKNIKLEFSVKITDEINVDLLELGILIGNALDNAIEATENMENETDKTIFASIITMGGRVVISVENSVNTEIDTKHIDTAKTDKINHGYGLKSIKTIAQKYDGDVFVSCERNIFTTSINICNTFEH